MKNSVINLNTASALSAAVKSGNIAGAAVTSSASSGVGTKAIGSATDAEAFMRRSAVNSDAVKEIISGGRTYTGTTKFFYELPTITPRQFVGAVAFLIDDIISGKKNRLLNFIGRLKIKWRTLTKKFTVPHR